VRVFSEFFKLSVYDNDKKRKIGYKRMARHRRQKSPAFNQSMKLAINK